MAIILAHHLALEISQKKLETISVGRIHWNGSGENLSHLEIVGFKCYKTRVLKSEFDNRGDWCLQEVTNNKIDMSNAHFRLYKSHQNNKHFVKNIGSQTFAMIE